MVRSLALAAFVATLRLTAAPVAAAEPGQAPCRAEKQAELPLSGDWGHMLVRVEIDGAPFMMLVDTGAQWTTLTPETVKRLNLPADNRHGGLHRGIDAFTNNVNAVTRSFKIGGLEFSDRSLSVAPITLGGTTSPPIGGLLGGDFLFAFDLDIDLPRRTLTLYRSGSCPAAPPWGMAYQTIPLVKSGTNRLNLAASVDGHPFRAILDTGASVSLITRPNALRAGVSAEALERDPIVHGGGLGTQPFALRRHVFGEVEIGPERFKEMPLIVGGTILGGGDLLLGLDYLGRRRVWLSYATRRLLVAKPEGAGQSGASAGAK